MASGSLVRSGEPGDVGDGSGPAHPPQGGRRAAAVRSGLVVAALGVLTTLPFYLIIAHLQAEGRSAAAIGMADMPMGDMGTYWAFPILQASGIAALIWAYLGVLLGLLESGKHPAWLRLRRAQVDRLHRQISLLVLGLILVHALATAFDAMGDGFLSAFVPWQQSWGAAVLAYNVGIFALYLAVLVGPTYYLRRKIGPVRWRFLHRFALLVYILSVWHTLLLGLDFTYYPWVRPLTWLVQLPLLVLFARRLLRPARRGKPAGSLTRYALVAVRYGLATLAGVAAVAIVGLVVSGHSDWPARVGHNPRLPPMTGNALLPVWLGVAASLVFLVVLVVHVWHLFDEGVRGRAWHCGHVLMAAGMIDMFLPTHGMVVSAGIGEGVFAVSACLVFCWLLVGLARGASVGVLWIVLGVDLSAMVYMFAMSQVRIAWLSWLLVAWFVLQAAGWATGRLSAVVGRGGLGDTPCGAQAVVAETGGPGAASGAGGPDAAARSAAHSVSIRLTLLAMNLGMAYMFVAMQLGMTGMTGDMPGMQDMGGMSGMPGM